jgi:hypothetical protein
MPTLIQLYEYHAEDCIRSAAKADDPKQRDLLLKLASAWREDAERLRRGEELPNLASAWPKKALRRVPEGGPSDAGASAPRG